MCYRGRYINYERKREKDKEREKKGGDGLRECGTYKERKRERK